MTEAIPARWRLPFAGGLLALAMFLFAAATLVQSRAEALSAVADTEACQRLAIEIEELRRLSPAGSSAELANLGEAIERIGKQCNIPASAIARISPDPPKRLSGSPYLQKNVQVLLRQLTLAQAARLVYELTSTCPQLELRSLRLSAPRQQEAGDRWTVELALSSLALDTDPKGTGGNH